MDRVALRLAAELPDPLKRLYLKETGRKEDLPEVPVPAPDKRNLLIGPANSAGQAHLWAKAAGLVSGWAGENTTYARGSSFAFDTDYEGKESSVVWSPSWARRMRAEVAEGYSAVLNESLRPMLGSLHFQDAARELEYWKRRGLATGVLFHGSDIRVPSKHMDAFPHSVFYDADPEDLAVLEQIATKNNRTMGRLGAPAFVSTPDQLFYRPEATWLPLQIAPTFWEKPKDVVKQAATGPPTVMHLPSKGYLKGTQWVAPQMRALEEQGVIRFLLPSRFPHSKMKEILAQADIVIDAIGMGAYGVTTVEALSLGKVVVAEVGDFVRGFVREATGLEIPTQEANRHTLTDVVAALAADPEKRARLGKQGRAYVEAVHSPQAAADALTGFLQPVA